MSQIKGLLGQNFEFSYSDLKGMLLLCAVGLLGQMTRDPVYVPVAPACHAKVSKVGSGKDWGREESGQGTFGRWELVDLSGTSAKYPRPTCFLPPGHMPPKIAGRCPGRGK